MVYSPDGRYIASAGGGTELHGDGVNQAVHIWDVETGQEKSRLTGCPGRVLGLEYRAGWPLPLRSRRHHRHPLGHADGARGSSVPR